MAIYEIKNFGGGIVDRQHLETTDGHAEILENFFIDDNNKLIKRMGIRSFLESHPQLPSGSSYITSMFVIPDNNDDYSEQDTHPINADVFVVSAGKLYVANTGVNSSSWSEVLSMNGNSLTYSGSFLMHSEGTPYTVDYNPSIHTYISSVKEVGSFYSISVDQFGSNQGDVEKFLIKSGSSWKFLNSNLPVPQIGVDSSSGVGSYNFLMAFTYVVGFEVDNVYYEMESEPRFMSFTGQGSYVMNVSTYNTPQNTGAFEHYYYNTDSSDEGLRLRQYRSTQGGSVLKFLTEVKINPASIGTRGKITNIIPQSLSVPDSSLGYEIYTESSSFNGDVYKEYSMKINDAAGQLYGGPNNFYDMVYPYTAPYKSATTSSGITWAHRQLDAYSLLQSKPGSPYHFPRENILTVPFEISAIATVGNIPIVFSNTAMYRVEGYLDSNGFGSQRTKLISKTVGCKSDQSILKVDNKIIFASHDGIYETDGHSFRKLTTAIDSLYIKELWGVGIPGNIRLAYDYMQKRVYFFALDANSSLGNVSYPSNDADKSKIWVIHLEKNNAISELHFNKGITSIAINGGSLVMGTDTGYVYHMYNNDDYGTQSFGVNNQNYDLDVSQDDLEPDVPIAQRFASITFHYLSKPINLGDTVKRKWWTKLIATFEQVTSNITFRLYSLVDKDTEERPLAIVKHSKSLRNGLTYIKRRFKRKSLRATYRQIGIRSDDVVLYETGVDGFGQVTVNAAARTILFTSGVFDANDGGTSPIRQTLKLPIGEYKISKVSGSTLYVLDPFNGLVDGVYDFQILGIPRNEGIKLEAMHIHYSTLGDGYDGSTSNGDGN